MKEKSLQFGRFLMVLSADYEARVLRNLRPHGLDRHYFVLLAIANSERYLTQQNLCEQFRLDKATVVRIIDSLEQRGFVERLHCVNDRRVHHLQLTEKAISLMPLIHESIQNTNHEMFESMSENERSTFLQTVCKLHALTTKSISSKSDV